MADPNKTLKILGDTGGGLNLDGHGYTPTSKNYDRQEGDAYDIYYDNDSRMTLQIQQGLDINFMRE